MRRIVLILFLLSYLTSLPKMWELAKTVDSNAHGTVPGNWDDWNYQVLAINLLRGNGFADRQFSSWESYHLSNSVSGYPFWDDYSFYRAPGFPLILSASYTLFGDQTLTARRLLFIMAWITTLLLLLIGGNVADWTGVIAGGIAGQLYLKSSNEIVGVEGILNGRLVSEVAATFWMILFAYLFTQFLRKNRSIYFYLSAVSLVALIFTRAYFLMVLPLFCIYLYFNRCNLKRIAIFAGITILPVVIWSSYASLTAKQLVILTTQGQYDFPRFNNQDVITGFGPERINQGGWQPGFSYNEKGEIIVTNQYSPKRGENGWIKGLKFWTANPKKLPKLFYVKMRAGLWYYDGRLYLIGIGFLLMSIGIRKGKPLLQGLTPQTTLALQISLVTLLSIAGNLLGFGQILAIWLAIALIGLVFPFGNADTIDFQRPTWFLVFLAAYLVVVLMYGGNPRFHSALDPFVIFISLSGLLLLLYRLIKTNILLAALYLLINSTPFTDVIDTLSK